MWAWRKQARQNQTAQAPQWRSPVVGFAASVLLTIPMLSLALPASAAVVGATPAPNAPSSMATPATHAGHKSAAARPAAATVATAAPATKAPRKAAVGAAGAKPATQLGVKTGAAKAPTAALAKTPSNLAAKLPKGSAKIASQAAAPKPSNSPSNSPNKNPAKVAGKPAVPLFAAAAQPLTPVQTAGSAKQPSTALVAGQIKPATPIAAYGAGTALPVSTRTLAVGAVLPATPIAATGVGAGLIGQGAGSLGIASAGSSSALGIAENAPRAGGAALASPEAALVDAVGTLQSGDWRAAQDQLEALTHREPKFRLAQFILADVLAARSGKSEALRMVRAQNPRAEELIEEYRVRLQDTTMQAPPQGAVPDAVLSLSGRNRSAIVVDLSRARLYVMQKEGANLRMVGNYYASIARNGYGKNVSGDLRTPVGVYHASSFTPGTALPPFYGSGAFPLDYPNLWDRMLGRTGSGIWLHGVPGDTYSRPPRTSEGCVVLANDDLLALRPWVTGPEATPVVFSDMLSWRTPESLVSERRELGKRIEAWRSRWAANDVKHYLALYAPDFRGEGMDRNQFANAQLGIGVDSARSATLLKNVDLFRYPGEKDLVMAEFDLESPSPDSTATALNRVHHQQFWRKGSDGQWKIVREDGAPELHTVAARK